MTAGETPALHGQVASADGRTRDTLSRQHAQARADANRGHRATELRSAGETRRLPPREQFAHKRVRTTRSCPADSVTARISPRGRPRHTC